MEYDLSFWELPDWRRESSVNPKFLAVAGVCFGLLILLGLASFFWSSVEKQKRLRTGIANDIKKIAEEAEHVKLRRSRTMQWETILKKLERKARARIVWCTQLAALQSLIPESVTLTKLQLSSQAVEVDEAPKESAQPAGASSSHRKRTRKVKMLQWRLFLTLIARGENAAEVSGSLSGKLAAHRDISPVLETAELRGKVTPEPAKDGQAAGKKFTIECKYKPVRWFDEPRKRAEAEAH